MIGFRWAACLCWRFLFSAWFTPARSDDLGLDSAVAAIDGQFLPGLAGALIRSCVTAMAALSWPTAIGFGSLTRALRLALPPIL